MRRLIALLGFLTALALAAPAEATNCATGAGTCFWIGSTGTLNKTSDSAHWSETTGGGTCSCEPNDTSALIFDGASGGGTVTVTIAGGTLLTSGITMGAFTGTLTFATSNNNVTITAGGVFSNNGSGTRTLNMGNGTWTILATTGTVWDFSTVTGLTFNANSSTLAFNATAASGRTIILGSGLSYATISLAANTLGGVIVCCANSGGTITTFLIAAPNAITFPSGVTTAITNAFTWAGSSGSNIDVESSNQVTQATISVASGSPTMSWAGIRKMAFAGGATFTATNSFDLGANSGITITAPAGGGGGGGGVIGGG